jgi:response regulator RpfG family c-di-GMP phosphodiesterase
MDTELLNSSIDNCLYESEIPILFITFYGIEERLFDLVNRKHTIGYLEKPIDIFSLYSCIQWIVKSYQNSKLQEKK